VTIVVGGSVVLSTSDCPATVFSIPAMPCW
jgi:hypothetical protein